MSRQIIPAHDERVQVTVEVPQKGKKKPIKFIAPRYEFVPPEKYEKFMDWFLNFDKEPDPKPEGWVKPVISDGQVFDQWVRILEQEDQEALLNLTLGEKIQIWGIWQEESAAPLDASEPSDNG